MGVEADTGMPGVIRFPPNEKQVTVQWKDTGLVEVESGRKGRKDLSAV